MVAREYMFENVYDDAQLLEDRRLPILYMI